MLNDFKQMLFRITNTMINWIDTYPHDIQIQIRNQKRIWYNILGRKNVVRLFTSIKKNIYVQ